LERIAVVNADPDLLQSVVEARVFGSYLDVSRGELGDVDVAIRLAWKPHLQDDSGVWATCKARAGLSGRSFRSSFEEFAYGAQEVMRALKARKPHLSLHDFDDLAKIGPVESRVIFSSEMA
jgi:hypothetical protein